MSYQDNASMWLKRALDIMFIKNPKATSMGVLLGFIVKGIVDLFEPSLQTIKAINISNVDTIVFIIFGVFILNLPDYLSRKARLPESVETAIELIKQAKKSGMPKLHLRKMWIELYYKIIAEIKVTYPNNKGVPVVSDERSIDV